VTDRVVTFQFCDDIRQEIGNKFSLIGCYAGGVIQVSPIPSVLPKLCAVVTVRTPVERPFRSLVTRIMNEGKSIAEIAFDPESISIPSKPMPEGATWHALTAVFVLTPFAVEAPCTLRVEAETEEETLLGGNVWIQAVPSGTPPEHATK
jgi:hypothetical protein